MSSDHDPGRRAPTADPPQSQLVPTSAPPAPDVVRDLCDTLTRVGASRRRWPSWLAVVADTAPSWWRRGYAVAVRTAHQRSRRVLTIAAAGGAALVVATVGLVATVQESWAPARVGSALGFDDTAGSAGDQRDPPAERTSTARETRDRPVADDADPGAAPDGPEMAVQLTTIDQADAGRRLDDRVRRRRQRSARNDAAGAGGDRAPISGSRPVSDSAPASRSAPAAEPAPAPAPQPLAAAAPPPATRSNLNPGSRLAPGDMLRSANGRFALVMQDDGNLVLYRTGDRAIWSTGTAGNPGALLTNQPDGNVVVNAPGGRPLWSTRTAGRSGAILVVQDDGNAVVYAGGGSVWSSGTAQ